MGTSQDRSRRVHPQRGETVEAEQALVDEWRDRLRRLVAADPQLADELRQVVELRSALADADPPQGATITMQATTFGTSRVNQACRELHVTTGE